MLKLQLHSSIIKYFPRRRNSTSSSQLSQKPHICTRSPSTPRDGISKSAILQFYADKGSLLSSSTMYSLRIGGLSEHHFPLMLPNSVEASTSLPSTFWTNILIVQPHYFRCCKRIDAVSYASTESNALFKNGINLCAACRWVSQKALPCMAV